MKTKFFLVLLIIGVISFGSFSQTGEGKSIKVTIKKKKPSVIWQSPLTSDSSITALTTRIYAIARCEEDMKKVEVFVNGAIEKSIDLANSADKKYVIIDRLVSLVDGENVIFIVASSSNESIRSDSKTITVKTLTEKPLISWIYPNSDETINEAATIDISACIKSKLPVKGVEIYLNDKLLRGVITEESSSPQCDFTINKKINLQKGVNSIYIIVKNDKGSTTSKTKIITYDKEAITQKRIALIIGNSNYLNNGKLKNPRNDAEDISNALKRLNFDVEIITDADFKTMGMAIDRFGVRVKGADISFFYYAGHGVQVKGVNYLIPVDADISEESQVKYACIDANQTLAYMESGESKVNIIVMDACRDNPFERSWKRSIKGQGLASMDAPVGSIVAYSTQPGNTAADGLGKNGLYTSALLEYIEQPELSLSEVFMKVRVKVLQDSEKQQQPWESSSLTQNVYLLGN